MARALLAFAFVTLAFGLSSGAEDRAERIVFTRDVAPIIFAHCTPCHRPGGAGPFSLTSYPQVRRRAEQIAEVTRTGYMPPWLPEPGDFEFANERRLQAEQISTIRRWVEQGVVEGQPGELPELPLAPSGWRLGRPDLVVEMPRPFTLSSDGLDVFRNFVIPIPLGTKRWVRAYEFDPGNPRIVHHAVMNFDRTRASRRLDTLDPQPGFDGMPGIGLRSFQGHFVAWTPGNQPAPAPEGIAWRLDPGTDLVLNLHLLPSGKPEPIRARFALYFTDRPPTRTPFLLRLGSKLIDIPPGEKNYEIRDSYTLPVDVEVLGIYPHAHYLGKTMRAWAEVPGEGAKTLLRIDDWDFNWQDDFQYAEPVQLPAGTRISMRFTYDNSPDNVRNPNFPPRRVVFGPSSFDEMGDLWIQVVARDPGELVRLQRHFEYKDVQAHIAGLEQLLARSPREVEYLNELGLLYLRVGRLEEATARLRASVRADPAGAEAHDYLGLVYQAQGRREEAIAEFRQAVRLDPDDAMAHNNLGVALRAAGDLDGAIEQYREVLRIQPDHARAHGNLGVALQARGEIEQALVHYTRALELEPDSAKTHHNLASALASLGRPAQAEQHYREALRADPGLVAAHYNLGRLLQAQGRWEEALASYRGGLRVQPDSAQLLGAVKSLLATRPEAQ